MSSARVQSIEAVQGFAEHLQSFRLSLAKELEALQLELRRVSHWIQDEALNYWQREQQSNARSLAEHLQQLSRCMSYVRQDEQRPCTEERKRVARAKERAQLCEQKIRCARAAAIHWETRMNKIMTKLQVCRDLTESDLLVAVGDLRNYIERLESYTLLRSEGLRSEGTRSSGLPSESGPPGDNNLPSDTNLPIETTVSRSTQEDQTADSANAASTSTYPQSSGEPGGKGDQSPLEPPNDASQSENR